MARTNGSPPTTNGSHSKPPTLAETEKFVREQLANANWLDPDGLDKFQVDRFIRDQNEMEVMEWAFETDPKSKTPAALDRHEALVKRVQNHREVLGLNPLARYGIKQRVAGKPFQHVEPDRSPERLAEVAKILSLTGAWGLGPLRLALADEAEEEEQSNQEED